MSIILAQAPVDGHTISGSTITATFGSNTTTGNAIVAVCFPYDDANVVTVTGITVTSGTAGTGFNKIISQAGVVSTYNDLEIWLATGITGGTTPGVVVNTTQSTSLGGSVCIYEFSGLSATADGTAAATTGSGTTLGTSPAITTSNANDIIFGAFTNSGAATGGKAGWQSIVTTDGGISEYIIVSSTQTSLTATESSGTSVGSYGAVIMALREATASTINIPTVSGSLGTSSSTTRRILTPMLKRF